MQVAPQEIQSSSQGQAHRPNQATGRHHAEPTGNSPGGPSTRFQSAGYMYYSESFNLAYQNGDGDVFEVSYRAEAMGAYAGVDENARASFAEQMDRFIGQVSDFVRDQERKLFDWVADQSGIFGNDKGADPLNNTSGAGYLNVPDYWNAENTSQRIFEFAISFFDASSESAGKFGQIIRDAVKKGFDEAMGLLGNLPEPVENLLNDTRQKTFEKIDAWVLKNTPERLAA